MMREYLVPAGDYLRVHIFPVRRKARGRRGHRYAPTCEAQRKLNARNARHALSDLLNINFGPADVSIRLSYAVEPESPEAAVQLVRNYIRRVKLLRRKYGLPELKYLYTTEQGKKSGRLHHHLVISGGIDRDTLEALWGHGYANSRRLQFDEHGLIGLAHYLIDETKLEREANEEPGKRCTFRRWHCSKNLIRPEPKKNDYRIRVCDAKYIDQNPDDREYIENLYPGYRLAECVPTAESGVAIGTFLTLYLYRADTTLFSGHSPRRGAN